MSKLLERAKIKRINALNDYQNIAVNDAFLDDCCFNLQQGIENTLKYIVEMNGENYIENHDVRAQLNKLSKMNVSLPMEEKIKELASTLNEWKTQSRYNDNFTALIDDIKEAMKLLDDLIEYADKLAVEVK